MGQDHLATDGHATGTVLGTADVDATTSEITPATALLDQIGDVHGMIVTADALHCGRNHVTYLPGRGAHTGSLP